MQKVTIYTDGACSGNPGPGGWGAILMYNDVKKEISGGDKNTTNNQMELTAAIEALNRLKVPCEVTLYSDSAYLINCFKQNWWKAWRANGWKNSKKEPVANQDLWEGIIPFFMKAPGYDFIKVKGHAGNEYNEIVDKMAVRAKEEYM